MTYHSTRLTDAHELNTFDCGVPSLNSWLGHEAMRAQRSHTSRVFVWTDRPDSPVVRAYFAFAPTAILRQDLTTGQAGGLSGRIPGWLLTRLALTRELHGRGLGTELLLDALGRIVGAAQAGSGRVLAVDAIDADAARFYAKHEFVPVPGRENRLILKIATAMKIMGVA